MTREKHYIAVDKEEVMRCTWCGSAESNKWRRGKSRGVYCSTTCENADGFDAGLCCMIITPVFWIFILLSMVDTNPELFQPSGFLAMIIFMGPLITIFGLLPLILGFRKISIINKVRAAVPKGSKDFDKVFDERYLHCEKCGAPLEMIDGAIPVKCSYCGFLNRASYT
jgi:LSD1 subclass zinc finger protein